MNKILIAVLLTLAATATVRAETYMDLEYTTPEGWSQYPGKCRGVCLLNEASKARMDIYTTAGKTPMDGVKAVIGKPNKKGEIAVAGRKGAWGAGAGKVVAATTMGSSIVVFVVEISQSAADADVAGWAALDGERPSLPDVGEPHRNAHNAIRRSFDAMIGDRLIAACLIRRELDHGVGWKCAIELDGAGDFPGRCDGYLVVRLRRNRND